MIRILAIITLTVFLAACQNGGSEYAKKKEILTSKKWMYDEEAIRKSMEGVPMSTQEVNVMESALSRLRSATFDFQADGTFVLTLPSGEQRGTWKLGNGGNSLEMLLVGASAQPNLIDELTEERIILAGNKETGMIFPKIMVPVPQTGEEAQDKTQD